MLPGTRPTIPKCVAFALALASACVPYGARPECPARGGASWFEVGSPHFLVLSDLSPEQAESTTRELEQNLEALTTIAFAHARTQTRRTTVVIFHNMSEFHAFFPELVGGVAMAGLPNDLDKTPFVVIPERLDTTTRVRFMHELTHDLFARNFGWAPPWLNEGWAQYYSTLRVENGLAHLGERLPLMTFTSGPDFFVSNADNGERVMAVPTRAIPRASEFMSMDRRSFYASMWTSEPEIAEMQRTAAVYAGSWALVHMLLDGGEPYTPRFRAFLEGARTGEVLTRAWERAFADVPMEKFDRDFRSYLFRRELAVWKMPFQAGSNGVALERRPLAASEVHLLWARLTRWGGKDDAVAKRDLDEAVAEAPGAAEPHHWLGLYALSHGDVGTAERELGEAVRQAPRDPRYRLAMLLLRTKSHPHGETDVIDAIQGLSDVAETAFQLRIVAEADRQLRRTDAALAFARKAYALASIDPQVLDTYAAVLFDLNQFEEAAMMQRKAVACLPEDVNQSEFSKRLQTYEARASARAP
jgi:Tfp pilus assembly protein PilF